MRTPTISELITSVSNYMRSEMNLSFVGRTFLFPFAIVIAGVLKLLYLYASSINKNIWIDTADSEASGGNLERFASIILGRDRLPAIQGQYIFDVVVSVDGTIIPAGTTWKQPSGDFLYTLDNDVILNTGTFGIMIRALDAGTESRLEIGDELEATQPLSNVEQIGTISLIQIEPTDGETLEEYRQAAIQTFNSEPTGGSGADYRAWASDIPSIRTVYPYVKQSEAGIIQIYVEAIPTGSDPYQPTLPTTEQKNLLYEPVEIEPGVSIRTGVLILDPDDMKPELERGRMPVGVFDLEILDIIIESVELEITNLEIPGSGQSEVQERIDSAVKEYVYDIRPFVSGFDDPNVRTDTLRLVDLASVVAQSLNDGETVDSVVMKIGGIQTDIKLYTFGDVPELTVTYL